MSDNFAEIFWAALIVAAVAGWATIEGLIWVFRHISIGFGA